jgi:hypothetical protein
MKTVSRMFLTLAMVMFIAGMGMSQIASTTTPEKKDTKAAVSAQGKFVDSNKNGICDNHESKTNCAGTTNCKGKNSAGACDHSGKGCKPEGKSCGQGTGGGNCCGKGQQSGTGCGNGPQHKNSCSGQEKSSTPKK